MTQTHLFKAVKYLVPRDVKRKGDFVYMDPPYVDTFEGYTKKGFGEKNHKELFSFTKKLPCNFVMSNSNNV